MYIVYLHVLVQGPLAIIADGALEILIIIIHVVIYTVYIFIQYSTCYIILYIQCTVGS